MLQKPGSFERQISLPEVQKTVLPAYHGEFPHDRISLEWQSAYEFENDKTLRVDNKGLIHRCTLRKTGLVHADVVRADSHDADWYRAFPISMNLDGVDLRNANTVGTTLGSQLLRAANLCAA